VNWLRTLLDVLLTEGRRKAIQCFGAILFVTVFAIFKELRTGAVSFAEYAAFVTGMTTLGIGAHVVQEGQAARAREKAAMMEAAKP
jgi:hypothetical protein